MCIKNKLIKLVLVVMAMVGLAMLSPAPAAEAQDGLTYDISEDGCYLVLMNEVHDELRIVAYGQQAVR